MALLWLLGFSFSFVLSSQTDFLTIPLNNILCLSFIGLVFLSIKNLKREYLLFMGFFWGLINLAPSSESEVERVTVIQTNPLSYGQGLMVKSEEENRYYLVKNLSKKKVDLNTQGYLLKHSCFRPFLEKKDLITSNYEKFLNKFDERLRALPPRIRSFTYSVILGEREDLGGDLIEIFKFLGLYHLLVVSGLHIAYISISFYYLINLPFRLLYAFCFIRPHHWYFIDRGTRFISSVVLLFFAMMIGFPPPVQRAVIIYIYIQVLNFFGVDLYPHEKIQTAACLHSLLFPLDFFSVSSVLSWASYLTVLSISRIRKGIWLLISGQLILTLYPFALLGQLSVIGLVSNFIVVPIFPFITICFIPILFNKFFPSLLVDISVFCQDSFLTVLELSFHALKETELLCCEITEGLFLRVGTFIVASLCTYFLWGNSDFKEKRKGDLA